MAQEQRKAGRPKNSRNKSHPANKLQEILNNGMKFVDLKLLLEDWLKDEKVSWTPAQRIKMMELLLQYSDKMLEKDFKENGDAPTYKKKAKPEEKQEDEFPKVLNFASNK